ncbi:single-stranded DNA-binding protein [Phaeacidiphilus oryzae]|uniref:single-stranded DNA-binding protein n=1 Tax=Phaeacidiphilus oryzae TaxID=348818 RepID=UPI00056392CA|nr:single-stranded DNA-binding protein [Phaeacidiphilus oryzae]
MSLGETTITLVGNLTSDPELTFTPAGAALAKFTIASTPRSFDKNTNEWKDGTTLFLRCTAWRDLAEHVTESLAKGARVIATGRLRQFDWTTEENENRSMFVLDVEDIGPSLRWATAKVERTTRSNANRADGNGGANPWDTLGSVPATSGTADSAPF